ncbi:hypothetical protein E1176_09300 [Fulvivirga sp. RKSG066]|uniref:J domain-containing protein n=1 Tax=Fulvivirga aurantia TaxID=2529383 RepID=UPI0012BC0F40|nr:DnaJ domain-containing protein [Fulvivirga aurantia]MTI21214.1 hypothetical protein [Fulvivirga aurantia]
MHNEYLNRLGLSPGATKQELKNAYRTLSKKHHPDVSKDPLAKERFIEITEAYNFLISVGPKPHNENVRYDYNPFEREYESKRNQAKARARQMAREKALYQKELITTFLSRYKIFVVLIVCFNIMLLLDSNLPMTEVRQEVLSIYEIRQGSTHIADKIRFSDYIMKFEKGEVVELMVSRYAVVFVTPIFGKPLKAELEVLGQKQLHNHSMGIYKIYMYLIPFVLFMGFLYLKSIGNDDNRVSMAILMSFLTLIQLFMLVYFSDNL